MHKTRNILVGLVVLVIIGLALWKLPSQSAPQLTDTELIDKGWTTFQNYLAAASAHDLNALRPLSYQLSSACDDGARIDECNKLMDDVVNIGKEFNREEFTQVIADDKQVVLATERHFEENEVVKASARRLIFLTRDGENMKILFFTLPMQYTFTYKENRTPDEVDARLSEMIVDTDLDLADDEVENCVGQDENKCVKTDPNKRDTDSDGWWDGIEPLLVRAD